MQYSRVKNLQTYLHIHEASIHAIYKILWEYKFIFAHFINPTKTRSRAKQPEGPCRGKDYLFISLLVHKAFYPMSTGFSPRGVKRSSMQVTIHFQLQLLPTLTDER
jgi:hypothetical protein